MSETKNYHLTLTDDDQTYFKDWRESINGNSNSNMEKIDTALGEKANLSVAKSIVLSASKWSNVAPYSQTIEVEEVTSDMNGVISIAPNVTTKQLEMVYGAVLRISNQTDGSITITADGDKPSCDIPLLLIIIG